MNTLDSDQLPARGAAAVQARRFPRLLPERFGGGPASPAGAVPLSPPRGNWPPSPVGPTCRL